jgi:1-hydroxycarotenoid 3,4-desaturase
MSPRVAARHVAVVGGGFAGLAAASALAGRGHEVTLFEGQADLGGKARCVQAAGARVDVGPTLLLDARPLGALDGLSPAGVRVAAGVRRVDPGLVATFPGARRLVLWADPERLEASLADLSPTAPVDWRQVLDLGARATRLAEHFYAHGDLAGPVDVLRFLTPGGVRPTDVAPFLRHRTLADLVGAAIRTPELRRLLCHTARFLGLDACQAPAVVLVIPYLLATGRVLHAEGGLTALAGRLAEQAVKRGAALRSGEAVEAVELRDGRAQAVRVAGGERVPVDGLVAAVDPAVVATWLPGSALAARVARLEPTLSARVAWWVVDGLASDAAPHALHFPEESDVEPLYVTTPTAIEPGLAPAGTSIVYALLHGPPGPAARPALAAALLARLRAGGHWPDGPVLASGVGGTGHSCYGHALRPGLRGGLPLSQRVGGMANLWLAGGGVFPGPGVANALRSGLRAAELAHVALTGPAR